MNLNTSTWTKKHEKGNSFFLSDHIQVTDKERQAAERAYVKKYAKDWFDAGGKVDDYDSNKLTVEFVQNHPRYAELARGMIGLIDVL